MKNTSTYKRNIQRRLSFLYNLHENTSIGKSDNKCLNIEAIGSFVTYVHQSEYFLRHSYQKKKNTEISFLGMFQLDFKLKFKPTLRELCQFFLPTSYNTSARLKRIRIISYFDVGTYSLEGVNALSFQRTVRENERYTRSKSPNKHRI